MLCALHHAACRFAGKNAVFRSPRAVRHQAAASHLAFFKGKMLRDRHCRSLPQLMMFLLSILGVSIVPTTTPCPEGFPFALASTEL